MTDPDEDWVTWIEPGPTRGLRRIGATLLESGEVLRDYWLEADTRPIMTSARRSRFGVLTAVFP